jgi:hypothetical protein
VTLGRDELGATILKCLGRWPTVMQLRTTRVHPRESWSMDLQINGKSPPAAMAIASMALV